MKIALTNTPFPRSPYAILSIIPKIFTHITHITFFAKILYVILSLFATLLTPFCSTDVPDIFPGL